MMSIDSISEIDKVFTVQSIMDAEYKNVLFEILRSGETIAYEIERKMTDRFPHSQWVCKVVRNGRPYLEVTDQWPSQYICILKDKIYYVVYRDIEEVQSPSLERKLSMLEQNFSSS